LFGTVANIPHTLSLINKKKKEKKKTIIQVDPTESEKKTKGA
jgi:hypothetical protein